MERSWLIALFLVYVATFVILTLIFFGVGYWGIVQRIGGNFENMAQNGLYIYSHDASSFAVLTMTPLFIIGAIELVAWIFLITYGLLSTPQDFFRSIMAFTLITGLVVWYYSIF